MAKPTIAVTDAGFESWRNDISSLAKFPNVYCKLSGIVTEVRGGREGGRKGKKMMERRKDKERGRDEV